MEEETPESGPVRPGVAVVALTHDLVHGRSLVTPRWMDDATKSVVLPVPFGCSLDDVRREVETALRALSAETAALAVRAWSVSDALARIENPPSP